MDALNQIQNDLKSLLLGHPTLSCVPITTYKQQVVALEILHELGPWQTRVPGKTGVAIQIRMPLIRPVNPNVPGPQLAVEVPIRIFEDPLGNNTGLTAEAVGLEVLTWLDGTRFEGLLELEVDTHSPALKPIYDYTDRFTYEAVLIGQLARDYLTPRALSPTLSDNGHGIVSLGSADSQALIYYTTDGTLPIPGDASHAYAGPFSVAPGTTLRWFAWRIGFLPSPIQQTTVLD